MILCLRQHDELVTLVIQCSGRLTGTGRSEVVGLVKRVTMVGLVKLFFNINK